MKNATVALGLTMALLYGPSAWAGPCAEQIKPLQAKASQTDAKNAPGSQSKPTEAAPGGGEKLSDTAPKGEEGGSTKSAIEKIMEAKAHDQRGDEAACMEAVKEAKTLIDN